MKKTKGFTLAEVLITLAIIGIVAAITLPSLLVNVNESVTCKNGASDWADEYVGWVWNVYGR